MGQEATRLDDDSNRLNTAAGDATTSDDPDVIEQEIEQTRSEMSGTIDAIQERLNPETLKTQAKDAVRDATIGRVVDAKDQAVEKVQDLAEQATDKVRGLTGGGSNHRTHGTTSQITGTARDTGSTIVETIRANPVPAAIAGAGLGWFLTSRSDRHQGRSTYMRNTSTTRGGYRGQQMDYGTGYTDWDRQQPDPGHLRRYTDDTVWSQMTRPGGNVVGMIQRNPVPAALAGVGLGWFLMRRSGGDRGDQPYYYRPSQHTTFTGEYGYRGGQRDWQGGYGTQGRWQPESEGDRGRMGEMAGDVQETAGEAMHRAQDMGSQAVEQVSHFGSMAQEQMRQLPHQAQDRLRDVRGTLDQRMHESPLMMGVVAMGLGLAVGMLLPETRKEQEIFGETRDELVDRAQEMAGQAAERVQEVAKDAAQAAQETVQEAAQQQDQTGSQSSATTG